jgi:hypothetical protein
VRLVFMFNLDEVTCISLAGFGNKLKLLPPPKARKHRRRNSRMRWPVGRTDSSAALRETKTKKVDFHDGTVDGKKCSYPLG